MMTNFSSETRVPVEPSETPAAAESATSAAPQVLPTSPLIDTTRAVISPWEESPKTFHPNASRTHPAFRPERESPTAHRSSRWLRFAAEELRIALRGWFLAYPDILFMQSLVAGVAMALVTFLRPNLGITGFIACLSAYFFGRLLGYSRETLAAGYCMYNPLLVGLGLGTILPLNGPVLLVAMLAGFMTLLISLAAAHFLRTAMQLPVLTLPFVLGMAPLYLAVVTGHGYGGLLRSAAWISPSVDLMPDPSLWWHVPSFVDQFVRSMGSILFLAEPFTGLVFTLIILWYSRILFALALFGFSVAVLTHGLVTGSLDGAIHNPANFNYPLVAMALGGIFLIPSATSFVVAALGVATSVLLTDAIAAVWQPFHLPIYTFPFNVTTLLFLYAYSLSDRSLRVTRPGRTPEETLLNDLSHRWRFGMADVPSLELPFFGSWTVWQGFDGKWTHQGDWRHACDFVIAGADGNTFSNSGTELADYYCFGKPVVSPVRGRVIRLVDHLPDQPVGQPDTTNNWGNHVLLQDDRGFAVLLAHFAQKSLRVRVGDRVEVGTSLGTCGNSGYSPQPHLHLHVQKSDLVGDATIPFRFSHYLSERRHVAASIPQAGDRVESVIAERDLSPCLAWTLADRVDYEILRDGKKVDELRLAVRMSKEGAFALESADGSRLHFGIVEGTYYHYRVEGSNVYLRLLLKALPSMPLGYRQGMTWEDSLPVGVLRRNWASMLRQTAAVFVPDAARLRCRLTFEEPSLVVSQFGIGTNAPLDGARVVFDKFKGFKHVSSGSLELRRIDHVRQQFPGLFADHEPPPLAGTR